MPAGTKTCKSCKSEKPFADFYGKVRLAEYPGSAAGISSECKACVRARQQRRRDSEGVAGKVKQRDFDLRLKYGIGVAEYNAMFAAQGGCCAICGRHQGTMKRTLAVDHDHSTGAVRKLLCAICNIGLGSFRDDHDVLLRAAAYLVAHKPSASLAVPPTSTGMPLHAALDS